MLRHGFTSPVLAALTVLCLHGTPAAGEEGLARRFPEGTVFYAAADDVRRALEAFRETGLGRIWYDEDMQSFLEPSMKWLGERVTEIRDETGFDAADLVGALSRRAAVGLWTDFAARIALITVIEPPDDETGSRLVRTLPGVLRKIAPRWRWDEAALDPAGVSCVTFEGGAFSFALHEGALFCAFDTDGSVLREVVWDEGRPRLSDDPVFADAAAKVARARDLLVFVNLEALWRGLGPLAGEDENLGRLMSVLDSLGLADTTSVMFGLAAEGPGFRTRTFVQVPGPRRGLYSLLKDEPVGEEILAAIPADAQYLWAGRLDLSRLSKIVRDVAQKVGVQPEAVDGVMAMAEVLLGFNPEADILGNIGDEAALVLIAPDAVGGIPFLGVNGFCLIVRVEDRKTFGRAVVKLIKMGATVAEGYKLGGEIKRRHGGRSIRGVEIAGLVAPSCTLTDEYLVLAAVPSTVKLVIDTIQGRGRSILEDPSFKVAFSRLDREGAVAISYGAKPEITSGPAVPMGSVASTGVMAGLLLPALSSARERARRTKCASNLKQIGFALHLFSADNDERFPESMDQLRPNYIRDDRVFACPSGGGGYVYVSGLSAASEPGCIVAFDAEGNHKGDGRNVLFVGGNVEWMTEERFQEALAKTRDLARAAGREIRLAEGPGVAAAAAGEAPEDKGLEILRWIARTFPFYRLPPLRLVDRNMFPSGRVTRWTKDGLLTEGFGPLPVSLGPSGLGGVTSTAVIAAIAIPNLLRTRPPRRRARDVPRPAEPVPPEEPVW